MFESMIAKAIKPSSVDWNSPKFLQYKLNEEEKAELLEIRKGADTYLHKQIDLRPGTSKEVFKKSEQIWRSLRDIQLARAEDNPKAGQSFKLNGPRTIYMIDDRNNLIDVYMFPSDSYIEDFDNCLENFKIQVTTATHTKKFYADHKDGTVKLICYPASASLTEEPYTPIVILEFNSIKSKYLVYTGILIYSEFIIVPQFDPFIDEDSYIQLVSRIDIDSIMERSKQDAAELYESYCRFKDLNLEISARELIKLLKSVGYKLKLDTADQLSEIEQIEDASNGEKIQEFFNTFTLSTGETAYDILALPELKKIFRFNELTWFDLLKILSKEYLNYEGGKITCDVLSNILGKSLGSLSDRTQTHLLENEIK